MIKGIVFIMLFYVLGELVSIGIGHLIPGNVCGMLLLFFALMLKWVKADDVRGVSNVLTRNMALFFLPAGVGLIAQTDMIADNWAALLTVSVVTTILVIVVVGWTQETMDNHLQHRKGGSGKWTN